LIDLLLAGMILNPGINRDIYSSSYGKRIPVLKELGNHRLYIDSKAEYELKFDRYFRFDSFLEDEDWSNLRYAMLPNINLLETELHSANNFDPLVTERYAKWMSKLEEISGPQRNIWLVQMDVKFEEVIDETALHGISFRPIQGGKKFRLYECVQSVHNESSAWAEWIKNTKEAAPGDLPGVQNPEHAVHQFRSMPSTNSGACRPPIPEHAVH
jgi:hypothetical protein